jgi:hypothetical protein
VRALPVLLAVLACILLLAAFRWLQQPPAGPQEPVWDKTACAACAMHLSEPGFAAQWHTPDGHVLYFDDPGCLMLHWRDASEPRGVWFHHMSESRWIPADAAAFARVDRSPMGFDLAAVDAGAPDAALDLAAARRWAEERF